MPRLLFVHAYALYTTLKNTVLSSFFFSVLKVIYKVFFLAVYPPPPLPKKSSLQGANQHSSMYWGGEGGGREEEGGRRHPPLPKYIKMAGLDMKSSVKKLFKFHLYYTQEKKDRKEKGVGLEMKLRYKLKLEGCFFFCWFFSFFSESVTLLLAA